MQTSNLTHEHGQQDNLGKVVWLSFLKFKISFFILFIMFAFNNTKAQIPFTLSGKIIEQSTKEPMQFVNVALYHTNDSSLVSGVVTDKNGAYTFTNVSEENFYLQISFIGFETIITPAFSVSTASQIDKGTIEIKPSSYILSDVVVTGEKSVLETSIDKKIYNVGKDIMSTSGSASQVLENIPSVAVSVDGNVSLRGSSNVTILINGRPSTMMRVNGATALQQIPANTIERIEIITNPSAKYKPDGTAGIINIVLKKGAKQGFNGTLTANIGNDNRYNTILTFNYRPGKINFFGSYGYKHDTRLRTSTDFRMIKDSSENLMSQYNYINLAHYNPQSHTANFGADYFVNDKNTIGISGNYFLLKFLRKEDATTSITDSAQQITNDFNRNRMDDEYEWDKELSAYCEHKFKKEDHTLNFELNLSDHYEEEDNKYTQVYRTPLQINSYDNTLIRQRENAGEAILEYANPISEDAEIEAGYSFEWINQDFDFHGEYFDINQNEWIKDIGKTNRFKFGQMIHAGYLTYKQSIEDFSFELGLRGEDALISSYLVTLDSTLRQNYFKLYPTLHLSYEVSSKAAFMLSYSKRVERPEGDELNPFPEYDDPRNLYSGNPRIKPEQIHSFEFGYQFKNDTFAIVPTLYYRYKYDGFTEVSRYINDSTLLTTFENLAKEQSAGMEMIFSWRFRKILTLNLTGNLFYNQIDASNLGYSKKQTAVSGNLKLGTNINLSKSTIIQLNSSYRSSELTPQGKNLAGYSINAGLRQDIFKGKASLLFTISDVFKTMRWESEINTPLLYQKTTAKRKSQIIYIGFTYRFGKMNKIKPDELKFDEQK